MTELTGATFAAMLAISGIAYMIFPEGARVPMQWGFDGKPTWAAPKLIGVLFSPILSLLVLSFASASDPQHVTSVLPMIAGTFLVAHVLHLALAQWHFNANKS